MLGFSVQRSSRFVEHQQEWMIAHEAAGQRQSLPLPKGDFDPLRPGGPKLCVQPGVKFVDHIFGTCPANGGRDGKLIVQSFDISYTHCLSSREFETEEVLECTGQALTP